MGSYNTTYSVGTNRCTELHASLTKTMPDTLGDATHDKMQLPVHTK